MLPERIVCIKFHSCLRIIVILLENEQCILERHGVTEITRDLIINHSYFKLKAFIFEKFEEQWINIYVAKNKIPLIHLKIYYSIS